MNALGADPEALFQPTNPQCHQGFRLPQHSDLSSWPFVSGAIFSQVPRITRTQCYAQSQQWDSLFYMAPFKHKTQVALQHWETFLYCSIPSSNPIINKEKAQNTVVFARSRLSCTTEGKHWNRGWVPAQRRSLLWTSKRSEQHIREIKTKSL